LNISFQIYFNLGILLPNLLGFYNEFFEDLSQENSPEKDRKELLKELTNETTLSFFKEIINTGKPIGCIGYGIVSLFQALESKEGIWLFKKFNVTGIPILAECRESHFPHLPFIVEETVRFLKGTFIVSQDVVNDFMIVDRNLITAQNDSSLINVLKNMAHLITKDANF
jgi:putative intracellular protease/amidase